MVDYPAPVFGPMEVFEEFPFGIRKPHVQSIFRTLPPIHVEYLLMLTKRMIPPLSNKKFYRRVLGGALDIVPPTN